MNDDQREQLREALAKGAPTFGFAQGAPGDVWTTRRIAALIKDLFGVSYHPAHVSRVVRALNQRVQLPQPQATQRDDAVIAAWHTQCWPALKKKAAAEGRTIVWVDDAGFSLLPARVRTYAPRGQTPTLRVPLTRDHLWAIGALTADGRVLMQAQTEAFRGPCVMRSLRHLLQHIRGKLLVIWDGSPIHRAKVVKALLAEGGAPRLWLEQLPGYAPDLNPVEGIWHYLKRVRLGNVCCRTLTEVRSAVRLATAVLWHKTRVLAKFPRHYGCPL